MRTDAFDFELPPHLIAQNPAVERSASRLLQVGAEQNPILQDSRFNQLAQILQPNDCLIFNDTRVIKARMFGEKATGGAIETLFERVISENEAWVQIRASRAPKIGSQIVLAGQFHAQVIARDDNFFQLRFLSETPIFEMLDQHGQLPLPPYITHSPEQADNQRYQTIYAKHAGAVAAPTAGLHFDEALFEALKAKQISLNYLTLHVGAGTFQPVRAENIEDHKMHFERYHIPTETAEAIANARKLGGRIIAVGTTSLRALESAARQPINGDNLASAGETDIFITPGFEFKVVDMLITNFHLPKSTLMMLVSAFAGIETIKLAYQHAIKQEYRFFSYGDAMILTKALTKK